MSQSGSSSYHHRDDLKCHSAGCRQGLIAWEWAWETSIAKPAAGSRAVGATSRTETLQHRQTRQLGTQGTRHSKQTQMCAIRGNHLSCSSYHRGSGLSSDTRPCRANLSFTTAPKLHIGLNVSYTWGWLASTSVCLRIRPKSPRLDPRNCCIWCRASSKELPRTNSMAAQHSMPSTDMATSLAQNGLPGPTHEGAGNQTPARYLVSRRSITSSCWLLHRRIPPEMGYKNSWKQNHQTDKVCKKSFLFQKMGAACLTKLSKLV